MNFIPHIKSLENFKDITPISGGYSSDKKYLVVKDGQKFQLRIFDASCLAEKESEFNMLKVMEAMKVRSSRPIEIGLTTDKAVGYLMLSYIDGTDGKDALPTLSTEAQYQVGLEAGRELKKINSYLAPSSITSWLERKRAKHQRYRASYEKGDLKINFGAEILDYIDKNIGLMENRPNVFQHDDFHPANLVVQEGRFAGVIDFGRHDWGDPVHEFIKLGHFSSSISVPYSIGQIIGYHDGKEPDDDFWKLYSLYTAMSLFSAIVWTQHVCPDEMPMTIKMLDRLIDDHEGFQKAVPKWFS